MFNVRIKQFYDTEQIQIFQKTYHSEGEILRTKVDESTGEILPREKKGAFMFNPFEEEFDRYDFFDMDNEEKKQESIRVSCSRSIKMIYDVCRANCWDWFVTFTFSPEKVDRFDYTECTKKLSHWLNRLRKRCPDMVYIVVPEKHKSGAFHFHGLFAHVDSLEFIDSGHIDKSGNVIYNVDKYKFGFTTATKIGDTHKASSYLCKYITKELCAVTMNKKRYWVSRNVRRPVIKELWIEDNFQNRIATYVKDADFVKMVESAFGNCVYVDKNIIS